MEDGLGHRAAEVRREVLEQRDEKEKSTSQ
jgi:hypothetical protein